MIIDAGIRGIIHNAPIQKQSLNLNSLPIKSQKLKIWKTCAFRLPLLDFHITLQRLYTEALATLATHLAQINVVLNYLHFHFLKVWATPLSFRLEPLTTIQEPLAQRFYLEDMALGVLCPNGMVSLVLHFSDTPGNIIPCLVLKLPTLLKLHNSS